jgi:hypothetical protein
VRLSGAMKVAYPFFLPFSLKKDSFPQPKGSFTQNFIGLIVVITYFIVIVVNLFNSKIIAIE